MTNKKTIELTKKFEAPIAVLFNAVKDGYLLKSTGVKSESFRHDFRAGGEFSLAWACEGGGVCSGRYLEIEPLKVVRFTWNSRECKSAPSAETIVTVTLTDHGKYSEMKLVHEGLDAGFCYDDHLAGWTSSLEEFQAETSRLATVS